MINLSYCNNLNVKYLKDIKDANNIIIENYQGKTKYLIKLNTINLSLANSPNIFEIKHLNKFKILNLSNCHHFKSKQIKYLNLVEVINLSSNLNIINGKIFNNLINLHTIDLSYCLNLEDRSLKYIKAININLSFCQKITDCGLLYLKHCVELKINGCQNINGIGLINLYCCKKLEIKECHGLNLEYLRLLSGVDLIAY